VQQWNTQLEKSFGGNTTLAVGYLGRARISSATGAFDQQRASGAGADWTAAAL